MHGKMRKRAKARAYEARPSMKEATITSFQFTIYLPMSSPIHPI
jgi:hypothetical protein